MATKHIYVSIFLLTFAGFFTPSLSQEARVYSIELGSDDIECIRNHSDRYSSIEKPIIPFHLGICPNTRASLIGLSENSDRSASSTAKLLFLTLSDLRCIVDTVREFEHLEGEDVSMDITLPCEDGS